MAKAFRSMLRRQNPHIYCRSGTQLDCFHIVTLAPSFPKSVLWQLHAFQVACFKPRSQSHLASAFERSELGRCDRMREDKNTNCTYLLPRICDDWSSTPSMHLIILANFVFWYFPSPWLVCFAIYFVGLAESRFRPLLDHKLHTFTYMLLYVLAIGF